jgi:hypothetical protein
MTSKETTAITSAPTPYLWNSCVAYDRNLFDDGWDECNPIVNMDGNNTIAVISNSSVNFFSYAKEGGIINTTSLGNDVTAINTAINGNLAAVGAPEENNHTGVVYIFEQQGEIWNHREIIYPSDIGEGYQFGRYVDIGSDVLVVG